MDKVNYQAEGSNLETNGSEKNKEFSRIVNGLLSVLPARSQEIIKRRFGLDGVKAETLEKIGKDYSITRERVRQIVADALRHIISLQDDPNFKKAEDRLVFTIEENDGIIKESKAVELFNLDGQSEANAIKFLASCSTKIKSVAENGTIEKSWVLSSGTLEKVKQVDEKAQEALETEGRVLTDEEIFQRISSAFPMLGRSEVLSFLGSSVKVKRNKFGKWGLTDWPEINPKGTREKIYLVLKETEKPLHFTDIAVLIDKYRLGSKKAHPQTVHNELIKDDRFVLIGRGIYALSEWGYSQGTIKDVLKDILQKSKKPLDREEILSEVLKLRKVKKSTILINLNNEEMFERHGNLYSLRG